MNLTFDQFIVHFHQAVLENNLPEITIAYESGWNKYTEKFYARAEWPEAEVIAPLVNDGQSCSLRPSAITLHVVFCRPRFPHLVPRALLPSRILSTTTQHRRPLPLLRKQLRAFQLPSQYSTFSRSDSHQF